ncbi:hypothetical protein RJ641_026141 [Dillenia turbinata]|uniref:Uncharacterized protein n=1 Tax=Dillenia turbinata TaxID=194707 RepID=A0AAN8W2R9_9MAGN
MSTQKSVTEYFQGMYGFTIHHLPCLQAEAAILARLKLEFFQPHCGKDKAYMLQADQWNMLNKKLNYEFIPIYSVRPDLVKKALKHVVNATTDKLGGRELELLIAILPDNNGSLYDMFFSVAPCNDAITALNMRPYLKRACFIFKGFEKEYVKQIEG